MKVALTCEFHNAMVNKFPVINVAVESIQEIMGISLDQMRHKSGEHTLTIARIIFVHLCYDYVRPHYHLAGFICRSHPMISHWEKSYDSLFDFDKPFRSIAKQVEKTFNTKIQYVNI